MHDETRDAIMKRHAFTLLQCLAIALFVGAVVRRAWMCDDAFITVRAAQNVLAGHHFSYNGDDRVLGFTNPFWAIALLAAFRIYAEPFWVPILLGVVSSSFMAVHLVRRVALGPYWGALALATMSYCRCAVDYSTSGLENSLTHLLLVLYVAEFFDARPRIERLALFAGLAWVNRMDTVILLGPGLLWAVWRSSEPKKWLRGLSGLCPALAWAAFSVVYYGFVVPNAALAKLNLDIPRTRLWARGVDYLGESVRSDPMILVIVGAALGSTYAIVAQRRQSLILLGSALGYVIYLLFVGGDFMAGRLLSAVVVLCAALSSRLDGLPVPKIRLTAASAGLVATSIVVTPFSPFRDDPPLGHVPFPLTTVVNERQFYQSATTAWSNFSSPGYTAHAYYRDGLSAKLHNERIVLRGTGGLFGMGAGLGVHVVDPLGLTDPLLARIPFDPRVSGWWRPGHYKRALPEGYLDSLRSGENRIQDPCIREYWHYLRLITQYPVFSLERFRAIYRLHLPSMRHVKGCNAR